MVRAAAVTLAAGVAACAGTAPPPTAAAPVAAASVPIARVAPDRTAVRASEPALAPQLAMFAGLMPLRSTGADLFRAGHPTYDGRGVLIAILDSGADAGLPGLQRTTTGERKLLDIRDFSGEGRVALAPLAPPSPAAGGEVLIEGRPVQGFGRVSGLSTGPYYGGVFREIRLGAAPSGDLNGDGDLDDAYAAVVARASDGWVALIDANGDGSLADERAVRDYAVAQDAFTFRSPDGDPGPMTVVINLGEKDGAPRLDLVMDNSSHGSHVAGIAAGHDMFGVDGFDGVAPGAQLLALKIANNTRGGITVTGGIVRALRYAADVAEGRGVPLVANLSYGVGNEVEGTAVIDSLVNAFALAHPGVLVVISAGNDGPGLSTVGLPGSATLPLSVCALFPGVFLEPPRAGQAPPADLLGWWSARGGEVAKPDACAPGVAYSNVPPWRTGEEISGGTSMAAPQVAGGAALLQSGLRQLGTPARAIDLKRALVNTARAVGTGATVLDEGLGVVDVPAAFQWLRASHQSGIYEIAPVREGGNTSAGNAAYRRNGLASPADTVQTFVVTSIGGQPAARLVLESDAPWLHAPSVVEPAGGPVSVQVSWDRAALAAPGLYVGTVWARPATDLFAGASFGLTNTIVVPYRLDRPLSLAGSLAPGAAARYFLDVPDGSAGLKVRIDLDGRRDEATLYLFEPDGRPHRGGSSVVAGPGARTADLEVSLEDVVPGVYEAVVVAPPAAPVSYRFTAALPVARARRESGAPSVAVENRSPNRVRADVSASLIGTRTEMRVHGEDARARTVQVAVPDSVGAVALEVSMDPDLWRRLTDFGLTVFDADGRRLSDGPLHYPVGRQQVGLDSVAAGDTLVIELFPAFADTTDPGTWQAALRVDFLRREPLALRPAAEGGDVLTLISGERRRAAFAFGTDSVPAPAPPGALVEYRIETGDGAPIRSVGTVER